MISYFYNKFISIFKQRNWVEEIFEKEPNKMVKVLLEFDDGISRELTGNAAHEWWHDLHRRNCGLQVDWTRHKWKFFKKASR